MFSEIKGYYYDITDSTNIRAREYLNNGGALPAYFIANEQTAGRGRQGKSFYSPKNTGFYFTLALNWENSFNTVSLTTAVSVALLRTLKNFTQKTLNIKWVNDILADGKKVSGILCETVADKNSGKPKAVIIGIGINLSTNDFPIELENIATNLSDIDINRKDIENKLLNELYNVLFVEAKTETMKYYRSSSAVIGQDIFYIKNGVRFDALAVNIDENGGLEVIHPDGTKTTLTSGEITLRIK